MSQAEVQEWMRFYAAFPFDDFHRYHRPAAFIAQHIAGGEMEEKLGWLQPRFAEGSGNNFSDADLNTFKAFGVKPPGMK